MEQSYTEKKDIEEYERDLLTSNLYYALKEMESIHTEFGKLYTQGLYLLLEIEMHLKILILFQFYV